MSETTKRRFFSSTTLERAVLEAAGHYGLEPDQLAYSKLEKRGVASRGKVSIKVDPAAPALAPDPAELEPAVEEAAPEAAPVASAAEIAADDAETAAPVEPEPEHASSNDEQVEEPEAAQAAEPEEEAAEDLAEEPAEADAPALEPAVEVSAAPAAQEGAAPQLSEDMTDLPRTSAEARRSWSQATGPLEQAARRWTESLLRVASLSLDVEIYERDGELEVHLGGADAEVAVEDGGEVLRSIQHLLPRLMLGTVGESVHCKVDCNDFRELHEERLRAQALGAAAEAAAEHREVTLDPMHPADRRIVHLVLADNELVRTESLGRGFFKRVSIRGN